jgi:AcrR family transcriptional regulator
MPTEKTYHHGNLRAALIEQAIIILTADGVSALTLRRLAAEAGVSHGAPAHHFKNKAGLLSAVAAQSFRLFAAAMQREREAADSDPIAQLRAISKGYLYFAKQQPTLFQLIMSAEREFDWNEELDAATDVSYGILAETCALFEPSPDGEEVNETLIWSMVHGYAALGSMIRAPGPDDDDIKALMILLDNLHLVPKADSYDT